MNIIRNISVLILFFGLIILTVYTTRSYNYKIEDSIIHKSKLEMEKRRLQSENDIINNGKPSAAFSNMFEKSTPWMGYSDPDTITKNISDSKNIDNYAKFDSNKYSTINS